MHDSIRNDAQAKKKVFKNVLESPFTVKWPAVSNQVGDSILSILVQLLEPIGAYRKANRKSKKEDYPELNKRLVLGINSVTELLEKPAKGWTVFVCKRDIQPTHLCSHLLTMASMAKVKLVPLPQNAQVQLSRALYLPRVSAFALQVTCVSLRVSDKV
ncbi:RNase P, subunit Pop3 [Fennellomyces sp. T-0311]|nr:RNase P, subunit Pop3 [Fennellomyces sp. T-0311]